MSLGKLFAIAGGGVLLILVVGFLTMKSDEIETRAEIRIDAAPLEVWDILIDPELRPRWMENVTSAALMTGTAGEADSSMMLRVQVDDFNLSVYEEVKGAQWPDFIRTITTDNQGALSVSTAWFLESGNPGTLVKVVAVRDLKDSLAAYFAPFIASRSKATLEGNLERLKQLVEERTR